MAPRAKLTAAGLRWLSGMLRPVQDGKARGRQARAAAASAISVLESLLPVSSEAADPRQPTLRLRVLDDRGLPTPTAPQTGPVWETDYFRCEHFSGCLMEVRHCLERQGARWPGGNRLKSGKVREKKAGVHAYCSSGRCEQGVDLRARCSYRPEDTWSNGRFKFFRDDTPDQRRAMRQHDAVQLRIERDTTTPFQEAASLTADDDTLGVDEGG